MSETTPSSQETPEPATGPVATTPPPPPQYQPTYVEPAPQPRQRGRLSVVAAWVGIVTGCVVTIAVIFFSGYFIGAHSSFHRGYHGGGSAMMHRQGTPPPMLFPMQPRNQFNRPASPFGPGIHLPGQGPGPQLPGQGPGPQPPGGAPSTTAPSNP